MGDGGHGWGFGIVDLGPILRGGECGGMIEDWRSLMSDFGSENGFIGGRCGRRGA